MPTFLFKRIIKKIYENKNRCCRICADTLCETADKWIHPCKCKGSMLWVHHECLKKWMEYSSSNKCTTCGENYKTKRKHNPSGISKWLFCSATKNSLSAYFLLLFYYSFYAISKHLNRKYKNYFFNWFYILRGVSILSIIFYISFYYLCTKLNTHYVEDVDEPNIILDDESIVLTSFIYIPSFIFKILKNIFNKSNNNEQIEILDY
jgi:hypothetical protein